MTMFPHCDGCGAQLSARSGGHVDGPEEHMPLRRIHGERTDGSRGQDPLPDGEFDWCGKCAVVAFAAVRDAIAGHR